MLRYKLGFSRTLSGMNWNNHRSMPDGISVEILSVVDVVGSSLGIVAY